MTDTYYLVRYSGEGAKFSSLETAIRLCKAKKDLGLDPRLCRVTVETTEEVIDYED